MRSPPFFLQNQHRLAAIAIMVPIALAVPGLPVIAITIAVFEAAAIADVVFLAVKASVVLLNVVAAIVAIVVPRPLVVVVVPASITQGILRQWLGRGQCGNSRNQGCTHY